MIFCFIPVFNTNSHTNIFSVLISFLFIWLLVSTTGPCLQRLHHQWCFATTMSRKVRKCILPSCSSLVVTPQYELIDQPPDFTEHTQCQSSKQADTVPSRLHALAIRFTVTGAKVTEIRIKFHLGMAIQKSSVVFDITTVHEWALLPPCDWRLVYHMNKDPSTESPLCLSQPPDTSPHPLFVNYSFMRSNWNNPFCENMNTHPEYSLNQFHSDCTCWFRNRHFCESVTHECG